MNAAVGTFALIVAFIAGGCGIEKAKHHQQKTLETKCQCRCIRIEEPTDADYREWSETRGVLTMAWGGGMWRCAVKSAQEGAQE